MVDPVVERARVSSATKPLSPRLGISARAVCGVHLASIGVKKSRKTIFYTHQSAVINVAMFFGVRSPVLAYIYSQKVTLADRKRS
jgi:hypothetical protein